MYDLGPSDKRQGYPNNRSLAGFAEDVELALMLLDDSSADPQTQPRSLALGLCRVKGVHNFSQVLLGDADAGVGEFDNHACRITGAGRHADRNSSTLSIASAAFVRMFRNN